MSDPAGSLPAALAGLQDPAAYPEPVERVEVRETHVSWVLLAGEHAWKIKKPLDLGFYEALSLERRRFLCEEELRLNRRTAPALYERVVPITRSPGGIRLGGEGEVVDYAVCLRRFADEALMSAMAGCGGLRPGHADALARMVAGFHAGLPPAPGGHGEPAQVLQQAMDNFPPLRASLPMGARRTRLDWLEDWTREAFPGIERLLARRRRDGFVRECHGDLHLGNLVWLDEAPVAFDGVEFSAALRCIDTMSEVAFLVMDLYAHGLSGLAWRFLDGYLEATGDHGGVPLLRFFLVLRALVRAKVAAIRVHQRADASARSQVAAYVELAFSLAHGRGPVLIATHGPAGSGKTTLARALVESLGAIRLSSDVERKRLAGLAPLASSGSPVGGGIYTDAFTERVYRQLADVAGGLLEAGWPTVVDAACLTRAQRALLRAAAGPAHVCVLACCEASEVTRLARLAARLEAGGDPSEATAAVLARQQSRRQPPVADEGWICVPVDTGQLVSAVESVLMALPSRAPTAV